MTQTSGRDFVRIYLESALLTLLAIAPSGVLMLTTQAAIPSIPLLASAILLGGLLWTAGLALLGHPLLSEVKLVVSLVTRRLPGQARTS